MSNNPTDRIPHSALFSSVPEFFVVVIFALTLLVCPVCSAPQQPPPDPRRISGVILDAVSDAPVAGANVTLRIDQGDASYVFGTRLTDASGRYAFENIGPAPDYHIQVKSKGYVSQAWGQASYGVWKGIAVPPGATNIDLHMVRNATISGTVLNETGAPVPDLPVSAVHAMYTTTLGEISNPIAFAKTDAAGHYQMELAPGSYVVETIRTIPPSTKNLAYPQVFYPSATALDQSQKIELSAASELTGIDLHVTRSPLRTIHVTVTDTAPNPDGAYSTRLIPDTWPSEGERQGVPVPQQEKNGPSHQFTFSNLAPGDYLLIAPRAQGTYHQVYRTVHVRDSDVNVNLNVGDVTEIRGRLIMEGDPARISQLSPLSRFGVGVAPPKTSRAELQRDGKTDSGGNFVIEDLGPGDYLFGVGIPTPVGVVPERPVYIGSVSCKGADFTSGTMPLASGESVNDCQITLKTDSVQVDGVVAKNETDLKQWIAIFVPVNPDLRRDRTRTAETDSKGNFQIRYVPPGEYFAFAVPLPVEYPFFDFPFSDQNIGNAERISIQPNQSAHLALHPLPQSPSN